MSVYKRGATIRILMSDFTETEWDSIYPYDLVKCEAEIKKAPPETGELEFQFSVTPDPVTKTIMLESISSEIWPEGDYALDVRFTRNGEHRFYPEQTNLTFKIIRSVTDD